MSRAQRKREKGRGKTAGLSPASIPHAKPADERVGVGTLTRSGWNLLQLLDVAASQHDVVGRRRRLQILHDVRHGDRPLLLAEALEPAETQIVFERLPFLVLQMCKLHRYDFPFEHHGGAEAGAETEEEHASAVIAAERLHRSIVHHAHRVSERFCVVEAHPSAGQISGLHEREPVHHETGVSDGNDVVRPVLRILLDLPHHAFRVHFEPRRDFAHFVLAVRLDLHVGSTDVDRQDLTCTAPFRLGTPHDKLLSPWLSAGYSMTTLREGRRLNGNISELLRRARDLVGPLATRSAAAKRALDLLVRDLLPRSAGGDAYLVVGIVGPNNAGKSALFNALVGRDLSPSAPTGGATRRLVGAAHPELLERLRAEPTLARFRLRSVDGGLVDDATRPSDDPAELLVAAEPSLPKGLMLIDTPDFDSILEDNRLASESLLAVADLVVAIVTKHSYQNREVVKFLERWLDHGRPWMLVYNEAIDEDVARAHAAKLAGDVRTAPLSCFWAPHDPQIQNRLAQLQPHRLRTDATDTATPESDDLLRDILFDVEEIAEVKSRAFDAALARFREDLSAIATALAADAKQARDVLSVAERRAFDVGVRVAAAAMPAGPFIDAFRTVLDRRSNPLSRSWRSALRQLRLRVESIPSLLRGRDRSAAGEVANSLAAIERRELEKVWPLFWEEVVRDLGREARHPARQGAPAGITEKLDRDLADGRSSQARQKAEQALTDQPADIDKFRKACETLVENAIEQRGFDFDIQTLADIATVMPLALAAVVIVHTGGFGSDVAIAGGGALSTFVVEKYSHLLGSSILSDARRRWRELRGKQLAVVFIDAVLQTAAPALRASVERDDALAARLRELAEEIE